MRDETTEAGVVQFLWPAEEEVDMGLPALTAGGRPGTGSTLVIIPTYNECENLSRLTRELLGTDSALDILVVDDASPDGTGALADRLADETARVHVMHRQGKLGLGTAYVTGFKYALSNEYKYVVQMDADFSHRPQDLPRVLAAARRADVVVGSRNVPGGQTLGWSPFRGILSKGGSVYARTLLRLPICDCTGGFKCFSRRALEALDLDRLGSNGFGFQVEVNYALRIAGMRFAEVPIIFPDREQGQSKMSIGIIFEAAWLVLRLACGITPAPVCRDVSEAEPAGQRI
jgi:dolichol-phosphate mannosyltransferase